MRDTQKIADLENEISSETDLMIKFELYLELVEALFFVDLTKAEKLIKRKFLENEACKDEILLFKAKSLLVRVYRAISKIDEAINIAEELKNNFTAKIEAYEEFIIYNSLTNLYIEKLKFEKAKEMNDLAFKNVYSKLKDKYKAHCHIDLGKVYDKLAYSDLAIEEYDKALKLFDKDNDDNGRAKVVFSVGLIFFNQNKYAEALRHFKQCLEIDERINSNNPIILLQSHILLANCYYNSNQLESGSYHYNTAYTLALESKNEQHLYKVISDKLTYLQIEKKHKEILKLGKPLINKPVFKKDKFFYYQALGALAYAYTEEKKYKQALTYYLEITAFNKKIKQHNVLLPNLLIISNLYKELKEYKKAIEYKDEYIELLLKLQKEKERNAIGQFQVQMETAEKEKEAEQYKNQALSFQLQSLRAQMNPHFVFNAINSISNSLKPNNTSKSKELLQSFARLMRANLDFAEQDTITLYEEIQFLTDYLELEKRRANDNFTFEINVDKNIETDFTDIPSMLIQPYVENAIKHGVKWIENGKIIISFRENEDYLLCKVKDNGIGIKRAQAIKTNQVQAHKSKSMEITNQRLNLINANRNDKVFVNFSTLNEDAENKGTVVLIKIPLS